MSELVRSPFRTRDVPWIRGGRPSPWGWGIAQKWTLNAFLLHTARNSRAVCPRQRHIRVTRNPWVAGLSPARPTGPHVAACQARRGPQRGLALALPDACHPQRHPDRRVDADHPDATWKHTATAGVRRSGGVGRDAASAIGFRTWVSGSCFAPWAPPWPCPGAVGSSPSDSTCDRSRQVAVIQGFPRAVAAASAPRHVRTRFTT